MGKHFGGLKLQWWNQAFLNTKAITRSSGVQ